MRSRVRVLSVVALTLVVAGLGASAAAARWTRHLLPVPVSPDGQFAAVSCVSATFCVAAGSTSGRAQPAPLIEMWDGTGWRVQTTPSPSVTGTSVTLTGISCVSAVACEAVGAVGSQLASAPVAERWDGARWTFQTVPSPAGAAATAQLSAVSCDTASDCMAVGTSGLAEHYDGTVWSAVPAAGAGDLTSVSCSSPAACTAVAPNYAGGVTSSVIERWNGAGWSAQTPPPGILRSVSCPSDSSCTAVGVANDTDEPPLIANWTPGGWTAASAPAPAGTFQRPLLSVSCASVTACVAVGERSGVAPTGYAETSAGGGWALSQLAPAGSSITAVSCAATMCMAVGVLAGAPLAERWNGTVWVPEPVSGPTNPDGVLVSGISCTAVGRCTAVGTIICVDRCGVDAGVPVAYRQAGTSWQLQILPQPNGALGGLLLRAISCPRLGFCMAVGVAETASAPLGTPLAERWSRGAWTVVPAPGITGGELDAVACRSPRFCMAVGAGGPGGHALAERWDGRSWSRTPAPLGPGLKGVACTSPTACIAVGSYIEDWNGHRWSVAVAARTVRGQLLAISCSGRRSCVAAGVASDTGTYSERPLVWAWNGRRWSRQAQASAADLIIPTNRLTAVACPSTRSCMAVGEGPGSGISSTNLGESWNGVRWSLQRVPGTGGLTAVACPSTRWCAAVNSALIYKSAAPAAIEIYTNPVRREPPTSGHHSS